MRRFCRSGFIGRRCNGERGWKGVQGLEEGGSEGLTQRREGSQRTAEG